MSFVYSQQVDECERDQEHFSSQGVHDQLQAGQNFSLDHQDRLTSTSRFQRSESLPSSQVNMQVMVMKIIEG